MMRSLRLCWLGGVAACSLASVFCSASLGQLITPADTVGVAVIGDDLSEEGTAFEGCPLEERSDTPVTPYNAYDFTWVEYLARRREMPMGDRVLVTGRRYFRRTNNVSRRCATTSEINQPDFRLGGQSQAASVRNLVAAGSVDIVIFYIGFNDLSQDNLDIRIISDQLTAADQDALAAVSRNVKTAWETITAGLNADRRQRLKLIVAGVPALEQTPEFRSLIQQTGVSRDVGETRLREAIDGINRTMRDWTLAQTNGVFADVAAMQDAFNGLPEVRVGNVLMDPRAAGAAPTQFFHESGHPRAVLNGIQANLILAGINQAIGKNLAMLTDREILISAGMGSRFDRVTFVGRFYFPEYITAAP